jgi:hypothetical protein
MTDFPSFRSIIEIWPTREACASELGASAAQVSKWWQRDGVPAEWWAALLATQRAAEAGLTAEMLTTLAARPAPSIGFLAEAHG